MKSRTTYRQKSFPNHLEMTLGLEELKLAGVAIGDGNGEGRRTGFSGCLGERGWKDFAKGFSGCR
jgi:hypothetical protein